MKNHRNPFLVLGTLVVIAMTHSAHGASATWNGTADATWALDANWSAIPFPGTDDIATFDNAGNGKTTIDLGAGVTVGNIIFDNAAVAAYTIGSGTVNSQTLTLNNSGAITANNTINANQIFNVKLVLGTDGTTQSYSITNNDASNLLTFAGGIIGGTGGTAGAKTLNVSTAAGAITLSGAITDGGASSLGLACASVSGKPTIAIGGGTANTYTGGTSVGNGVRLNVSNVGGLGSGLVTVASGGQVFLNSSGTYTNNFLISGNSWDGNGALRMGNGTTNTINGSVTLAADSRIGVDSSKTGIVNGLFSGAYALEKTAAGTLTLGGANSSIGNLTITAGTVRTENSMTFGKVDVAASATFNPGGQNAAYTVNINGLSGAGALTTANSGGFTRTLNVGNGDATSDFSGVITQAANRAFNLNKLGSGTLTLSGAAANVANTLSNGNTPAVQGFVTNVQGGTLALNKTAVIALPGNVLVTGGTLKISGTGSNQIADAAVLTLAGGTVEMAAASQAESIASTTLSAGASSVTQSQTASVLNMNVITRSVGGTINFGADSIATTDANNSSNGILGGWATVAGTDWATSVDAAAADTAITTYTGYTDDSWAEANNVTVTTSSTQTSGATANSLRFNAIGANTVTLAGTNILTTGGILVTSNVGNNLCNITGGTLAGANTQDLVIHQNNAANGLTIESVIANNTGATGLTKSGVGLLTLSNTNSYTGATTIAAGTLKLGNAAAINTTSGLRVAAGATFDINGNNSTIGTLNGGGNVTNSAASGTSALTASGGTWTGNITDGSNAKVTLTLTGSINMSGTNGYTGGTTISGGTLSLTGSGTLGAVTGALTFGGNSTSLNLGSTTQTVASVTAGSASNNWSSTITGAAGGTLNVSGNLVYQGNTGNGGSYGTNPGLTISTNVAVTGSTLIGRGNLSISGGTYSTNRFTSNVNGSLGDWPRLVISGGNVTATNGVDASYGTTGTNGTTATFQLELNGGTLATSLIKVTNRDLGTSGPGGTTDANLLWNGGTVKAIGGNNANFVQVYGDSGNGTNPKQATYVSSGGANIDTNGFDIGIGVQLLQNPSSTGGGLTKSGAGTLTLSKANTYTGNTTVNGGTLELAASTGSLKFAPTINGNSNKITGTGTLALNGSFNIDLAGAVATPGNSWTLVDVGTLNETFGLSFSVTDFTQNSDVWTKPDGLNVWTFKESTGVLTYTVASAYTSWIDTPEFGLTAEQKDALADPDYDGIPNLLEFVLNGVPSASDPTILPKLVVTATDFEFTFKRRDDSLYPETTQTFQYGTDLTGWTDVVVPIVLPAESTTVGAATITATDGSPADTVKVSIPKSTVAPSTKLFGRLQVTK